MIYFCYDFKINTNKSNILIRCTSVLCRGLVNCHLPFHDASKARSLLNTMSRQKTWSVTEFDQVYNSLMKYLYVQLNA